MIPDQPLFFEPIFRSYLWGGRRLETSLKKPIPGSGIWAESWEIVDHGSDQSVVRNGDWEGWTLRELIEAFPQEILGPAAKNDATFPLLLKYLDCQQVLSVQVHPDDSYAKQLNPPDLGKTEAWYVIDAQPDSIIYAGLKDGIGEKELEQAIEDGNVEACLHSFSPQAGDCIFIPAGTVHALGAGLVVAEIQQASDTTFRLFDWNRLGNDGKPRPLHIREALEVIDYSRGPVKPLPDSTDSANSLLYGCDKFQLHRWKTSTTFDVSSGFHMLTVVSGLARLQHRGMELPLQLAQSVLLPAAAREVRLIIDEPAVVLSANVT